MKTSRAGTASNPLDGQSSDGTLRGVLRINGNDSDVIIETREDGSTVWVQTDRITGTETITWVGPDGKVQKTS